MRIDAHHHLWSVARGDYPWMADAPGVLRRDYGADDLAPALEAANIDATIMVQAAPTEAETRFLLEAACATPWIAGVVGWADLRDAAAVARLCALPAIVGLRPMLQDIARTEWILDADCAAGLHALADAGKAFDALGQVRHLAVLDSLAGRHPDLRIVLDHALKPDIARGGFDDWAPGIATLARHGHVTCKLSGLLTEAAAGAGPNALRPYVEHLLDCFGPDRLIFGSDWPVMLASGQDYGDWADHVDALLADPSDMDRAAVMGGTARRVYRLVPRKETR